MKITLHRKTLLKLDSSFVWIYSLTLKCAELCLTGHLHAAGQEKFCRDGRDVIAKIRSGG